MNKTNWKNHLIASLIASLLASSSSGSYSTSMAFAADNPTVDVDSSPKPSSAQRSTQSSNQNQNSTTKTDTAEMTDADCWKIAGENFGSFGTMSPSRIGKLFGSLRASKFDGLSYCGPRNQTVTLDKETALELSWTRTLGADFIDEIVLAPTNLDATELQSRRDKEFGERDWESDTVYTYATGRNEDVYWKVLAANFQHLLGTKRKELKKLLGPERCSSKSLQTVDYKIGQQRLRFYFKNERVLFLQLGTVMYTWPNGLKPRDLQWPMKAKLWPLFEEKIDTLLGAKSEDYKAMTASYKQEKLPFPSKHQNLITALKLRSNTKDYWFLDDRMAATVEMESGLVSTVVFEPIQQFEDHQMPHNRIKESWLGTRPNDEDAVFTGAKRRDEATYWAAIKPNLRKLIGMKKPEILALLGPERCSSEAGKSIDYRVGNSRLRFFLRNDAVIGFQLTNDMYLPDT